MKDHIFKAYDIRGIYPIDIDTKTVYEIGRACAHRLNPGIVVISHDTRIGSPELMKSLQKGFIDEAHILNKKFKFEIVGLSTTPMFYFLVNYFKASGGMMITASHNPKEYNGIKMVQEKAFPITGTEMKVIVNSLSAMNQ